jgi:hypothetical protein
MHAKPADSSGLRVLVGAGAACLIVAACGPSSSTIEQPRQAAVTFHTAISSGDGASACAELTDDAAKEVEQAASTSCDEAILDADLPRASQPVQTDVYGREARAVLDGDIVFLTHTDGGWRVVAAGCTPQGDDPYDCTVQGG